MKTLKTLFGITLLSFLTSNAQITKGNWMVGGNGNFTNYKSTFQNDNSEIIQKGYGLRISPNLGYFIVNNFSLGTTFSFSYSNPSGDNNNSYGYGISPFAKFYFRKQEKILNPFFQASYGFSEGRSESGGTNKSNGYSIKGGTAIFFNSNVALEVSIDYDSSKNNTNSKSNNFSLGIGFQIHLKNK